MTKHIASPKTIQRKSRSHSVTHLAGNQYQAIGDGVILTTRKATS